MDTVKHEGYKIDETLLPKKENVGIKITIKEVVEEQVQADGSWIRKWVDKEYDFSNLRDLLTIGDGSKIDSHVDINASYVAFLGKLYGDARKWATKAEESRTNAVMRAKASLDRSKFKTEKAVDEAALLGDSAMEIALLSKEVVDAEYAVILLEYILKAFKEKGSALISLTANLRQAKEADLFFNNSVPQEVLTFISSEVKKQFDKINNKGNDAVDKVSTQIGG